MLSLVSREGAGSASSHVTHLKFQEGKIKAFLSLEQTRILNTSCGACERKAGHFSKRSGMLLSREVTRWEMEMHFLALSFRHGWRGNESNEEQRLRQALSNCRNFRPSTFSARKCYSDFTDSPFSATSRLGGVSTLQNHTRLLIRFSNKKQLWGNISLSYLPINSVSSPVYTFFSILTIHDSLCIISPIYLSLHDDSTLPHEPHDPQ